MPTPDQIRIEHDRAEPRLMALWWALRPLLSVVRFMQTGAHPDDEMSGMLAALAYRDGINISYACSTRGEGGQNDIGTETGFDLGTLRTREMERACDVLGMRLYWHSTHPGDTITDFGFSKSGDETLARWGRARTVQRFVEIIRTEKPDIICPTFLDVPGQHGHHRAMTEAAHEVMKAAADPAFATHLPPWQVKKLYLPAWSGAGQAYDDDLPPPEATLVVPGTDREAMTGWNWDRIGQQSRAFHRTQGMGRWVPAGDCHDWPLHLAESRLAGADTEICAGLPRNVAALASLEGADPMAPALTAAQSAIDAAVAAFPDFREVAHRAAEATRHLRASVAACPPALAHEVLHRLHAKEAQLGHVLRLALGIEARLRLASPRLAAGETTAFEIEVDKAAASSAVASVELPDGWAQDGDRLTVAPTTAPSDPYPATYAPLAPRAPRLRLEFSFDDVFVTLPIAAEVEPVVLPRARVVLAPSKALLNAALETRALQIAVSDVAPAGAEIELDLPAGWHAARGDGIFEVSLPRDVREGLYRIHARVGGEPASSVGLMAYDHVGATARPRPAEVTVGVLDIALPRGRVGYIGGGNDRVGDWLAAMGANVTLLEPHDMTSAAALAPFDAIVVGIFAMRFKAGLGDAMPALHQWTEAGGTLVTLYHRPWDNWDPDRVPPRRLEIGQPSLRWRVTDEAAPVTQLTDHDLLSYPNRIGPADWDGWVKERGLYFAKSWDAAYTPLLSMADPGEAPLAGSLLVADIGKGRHVHTSLILHHQMENLVPGAFRLMANLIAPRR